MLAVLTLTSGLALQIPCVWSARRARKAVSSVTILSRQFEAQTGHTLEFIDLPPASNEKLSLFQQLFAAKDSDAIDLFQADTVWIGVLDKHLLDLTDSVS